MSLATTFQIRNPCENDHPGPWQRGRGSRTRVLAGRLLEDSADEEDYSPDKSYKPPEDEEVEEEDEEEEA